MKSTLEKIAMGLAGAVALAGLMSAGVQTAQAQLEPNPLGTNTYPGNGNPKVTPSGSDYIYGYTLQVTNPSNAVDNLVLTSSSTGGYTQGTFSIIGFTGYTGTFTHSGGSTIASDWNVNYSGTTLTLNYNNSTDYTVLAGGTLDLGTFNFTSIYGPATTGDFTSKVTQKDEATGSLAGYSSYGSAIQVPAAPLPAAFWPGLLTIGGMAVVGGLRMRRRTVRMI